jgi:type VI secretion system secreted protein Hcp
MTLNAFIHIGNARGEAKQGKYDGWIEIQGWEWEVEAESSWTKGGGASVGKPNPGKLSFEHYYDTASPKILGYICTGSAFATVKLHMCKNTGKLTAMEQERGETTLRPFFEMDMKEAYITKINNSATDEGNVVQKVEMVFKEISIDYRPQGMNPDGKRLSDPGALGTVVPFKWDIAGGIASPGM